ncbi:hypothetical protein WICPIJ_002684 [Wickerhamomyces pijperi]|uniref:Uncharacterized protein n=1 Tax=Wickerhamomyces pijperi TaxID=599730 RepID=A0A9P8QB65_WICPI|nr:hypothetical protein WICPIJ_002684 [Wickerhamomyces pijperi]
MLGGIWIVWGAVAGNQGVKLSDHEQQHSELVSVVLQVDKDDSLQHLLTDVDVGLVCGSVEHDSELVTEFQTIGQERVLDVGTYYAVEDLSVRDLDQGLQDHHDRHQVLVLSPGESEGDVTVVQVMQDVCLGCLIWSDGSDLDTEVGVSGTSVGERRTDDGHRMVTTLDNQHSDKLLDTVDDEVTTHLVGLLLGLDQLIRRELLQVTAVGLQHDWHETTVSDLRDFLVAVDGPGDLHH